MSNREILSVLAEELRQGEALLSRSAGLLGSADAPQDLLNASREDYCAFTARVAGVAGAIDLGGLQTLMGFIDVNVSLFAESPADVRGNGRITALIAGWPSRLSDFILNSSDPEAAQSLRSFLLAEDWPWKIEASQLDGIIEEIRFFGNAADASLNDEEQAPLTADDVAVQIPDDINLKLLATFRQELPQGTAELSHRIQKLFDRSVTREDMTEARRVAHTLKGAANIVGVKGIANVTHYLEDILETLVKQDSLPSNELAEVLIEAADCLEIMAEAALGLSEPPPQALQVLQGLADWQQRFAGGEYTGFEPMVEAADVEVTAEHAAPARVTAAAVPETEPELQGNILDRLLDITGELSSSNLITRGQLALALKNSEVLHKQQHALHVQMGLLQELIYTQGLKKNFAGLRTQGLERNFDPLEMDQYNELHSIASLVTELLDDMREVTRSVSGELAQVKELLTQQDQLNRELNQSITSERLTPVSSILPRLQRSVRQTCRMTGKEAALAVTGESLYIDNSILDAIVDPLLHILRNAVDHGVEAPQERADAGKSKVATITLAFERVGNNIVIRCKDDGRGIDSAAVKNKALQLGLIGAEQIVTEKELFELILQPGFSTRSDANQVSGRGLGMDVVAKKVADLRGSLAIQSEAGKGTEFIITVPQTLLKTHVLLLRSGGLVFGILSGSFSQIVNIEPDAFEEHAGGHRIRFKDRLYDIRHLSELLGIGAAGEGIGHMRRAALLVDDADIRTATLIEEALSNVELFIKKIGRYIPRIGAIIGTVLTAEGMAVPVFDLKDLLRKPSRLVADYLQQHIEQPVPTAVNVLIVDDSSSARRSLSQVARDAGYDVRTAIDGVEAITLIEEKVPDLLLTDLEMPKMNGLELAAHLRSHDNTRNLPIVMVTSRSTEKHKSQAMATGVNSYITKPFTNDDLIYEMHQLLRR
ncbi:MAG TPA: response regulator [Gammaproteobacteria bacterium]|nr:response regulator [Gammaproteobacteria bacterium]